jgi:hypothetical protein
LYYRTFPPSWKFTTYQYAEEFEKTINDGLDVHTLGVVITDLNFGSSHISGSQLCQLLRRQYAYRGIIVGCSGDASAELFLREGANIVWSKPPPPNEEIVRGLGEQFERIASERLNNKKPTIDTVEVFGSADDVVMIKSGFGVHQ